jgi:hypothetical protein
MWRHMAHMCTIHYPTLPGKGDFVEYQDLLDYSNVA